MAHTVTVYSTPTCSWCYAVKDHLKSHQVSFAEVDVSVDAAKAREMVAKSGQYGVPVLDIDGQIVVGFDREKINALLGIG
jgi:glutaredoxin-like YruB-family protein